MYVGNLSSIEAGNRMRKAHEIVCFSYFMNSGIMYADTMSQATAKQVFGECARSMMEQNEIMVL